MQTPLQTPFEAIADPTRRLLLERLRTGGSLSLSELAANLPMTRQATTKHLEALRRAGLVRVRRSGRERLHELDSAPLRAVEDWLKPYAAAWDEALERLRRHVEENER
jgi:DNA-binding transcriptional ArsR family regulator